MEFILGVKFFWSVRGVGLGVGDGGAGGIWGFWRGGREG